MWSSLEYDSVRIKHVMKQLILCLGKLCRSADDYNTVQQWGKAAFLIELLKSETLLKII